MVSKPETKDWNAWEDRQPGPGKRPTLHVTGKVKISATNQKPVLVETIPQGINPKILLLDLKIETHGVGIEPVNPWAEVKYEKSVGVGQYTGVDILFEGNKIGSCVVKVTA